MHRKLLALVVALTAILLISCGNTPPPTTAPTSAASTQTSPNSTDDPTAESGDETQEPDPTDAATDAPAAPTATPEPFPGEGPWEVSFTAADGSPLNGMLYGQGTTAVVLAPMYNVGQEAWAAFAQELAAQGYRVMTFDYRGFGASEGSRSPSTAADDLAGAVTFMRSSEFNPVVLIGAGLGGAAAIRVGAQDNTVAGAVLISPPRTFPPESGDPLSISDTELAALTIPTLWLGTRNDMTQSVEELFAAAGGSDKEMWIYEGSSLQGTYIFEGADGTNMRQRLIEFVARVTGA